MTVQTICDRCGMEYTWAGVSVGDLVYCCAGCASGGPCTCGVSGAVAAPPAGRTTVVTDSGAVVSGRPVAPPDDVVIVE